MSAVGELLERKDRAALVRFQRRAVEDKAASLTQGHYVAKDVDYALITPPYSKDVVEVKVESWFKNMQLDVINRRMPQEWSDRYHAQYEKWKAGEELPLNGTAIKGWGMISPAQQETLVRLNILTVEDLAVMNDEGIRRVGMGSVELRHKAVAWLQANKDKGPLTIEVAALKNENDSLKKQLDALASQVAGLIAQNKSMQTVMTLRTEPTITSEPITASDIIDTQVGM